MMIPSGGRFSYTYTATGQFGLLMNPQIDNCPDAICTTEVAKIIKTVVDQAKDRCGKAGMPWQEIP